MATNRSMLRVSIPLLLSIFFLGAFYLNSRHVSQLTITVNDQKRAALLQAGIHQAFTSCNTELVYCKSYDSIVEVHEQNRCILMNIDKWANSEDLDSGVFHYGLPDHLEPVATRDVGHKINLSDMVSYLLTQFGPQSSYMEIGASVGKTIFQLLTINCEANVVAFDIEKLNPTFERLMEHVLVATNTEELNQHDYHTEEMLPGHQFQSVQYISPKQGSCTLDSYDEGLLRDNKFYYLSCDEFDEVGWNRMEQLVATFPKQSYQVIFSDAMNSIESLTFELNHIFRYNLLDKDHFAYIWDDMSHHAKPFCERIMNYSSPIGRSSITCLVGNLPGWFGVNEYDHPIAIVTTLDIREIAFKSISNIQIIRDPYSP